MLSPVTWGRGELSPAMATGPQLPTPPHTMWWGAAAALLILLLADFQTLQGAAWDQKEGATAPQEADPALTVAQGGHVGRRRRYGINPPGYKWDHVNLTYKIVRFPSTLSQRDTERAIATAFRMWSDVSPLRFQRLPPGRPADMALGFYTFNHTDCWFSPLHPCFDGPDGELAHAFLPPRGEIHFDNHEFWILGRSRFSWKRGVWLNDLVQVAAHEIGHALGLWHSQDVRALMHPNATYSRTWRVGHDDVWAVRRLYGCVDEKRQCAPWARRGFCMRRRAVMKRHCPQICNSCFEPPGASPSPLVQPPRINTKSISEGRVITFRCGLNSSRPHLQISWYKDGELLSRSVPGFELLPRQELRVRATEFSEGQYTCLIHRASRILRVSSWQIKLKARSPSPNRQPARRWDRQGNAQG